MKKSTKLLFFLMLVFFSTLIPSCYNDVELNNIDNKILLDEAFVVPAGTVTVSAKKFITRENSNPNVYINGEDIGVEFNDYVEIAFRKVDIAKYQQDINISEVPAAQTIAAGSNIEIKPIAAYNWDFGINKDIANERIDKAELDILNLQAKVGVSGIEGIKPSQVSITLSFGNYVLDANTKEPYTITFTPNKWNDYSGLTFAPVILDFGFDGTPGSIIPYNYTIKINNTGTESIVIKNGAKISFSSYISKVDYTSLDGYFTPGNGIVTTQIWRDITFIKDLQQGVLISKNPSITFNVSNGFTNIFNAEISKINFTNKLNSNITWDLQFANGTTSTNFAVEEATNFGTPKEAVVKFDKDNTNFGKIIADTIFPGIMTIDLHLDHLGTISPVTKLTKNTKLAANVYTKLPFDYYETSEYLVLDTLPDIKIDITSDSIKINDSTPVKIDSALLVLDIKNGLPINIKFSPVIYDSLGTVLDFGTAEHYMINHPALDGNGYATKVENQRIIIKIRQKDIDNLGKINYIVYQMFVNEQESKQAHFRSTDNVEVHAGVYVKLNTVYVY